MCEPVTIAGVTITAAEAAAAAAAVTAATTIYAADQQADATKVANENQRIAIHDAAMRNYSAANRQGLEERENQSQLMTDVERERQQRLGAARAAAAAGGIGGASVDALMLDLSGKGLAAATTSEINYARQSAARQDGLANLGANTRSQLAQVRDVSGPGALDYIGAGLQVGQAYSNTKYRERSMGSR